MSVFEDQQKFMTAAGQTVGEFNALQTMLYRGLIGEEYTELHEAWQALLSAGAEPEWREALTDVLDGCADVIVVVIGLMHSLGVPAERVWDEVMRSNLSKIDPETGKVLKRADGKVLKPEGFRPPNIRRLVDSYISEMPKAE